jgi:hypothetical protein
VALEGERFIDARQESLEAVDVSPGSDRVEHIVIDGVVTDIFKLGLDESFILPVIDTARAVDVHRRSPVGGEYLVQLVDAASEIIAHRSG